MQPAAVHLPRALPVQVGLVRNEQPKSLLFRLVVANHLHPHGSRGGLGRLTDTANIDTAALAALAGCPVHRLRDLLPDPGRNRFDESRVACRRCLARKGITSTVLISAPNHQPICLRHRRWLPATSRSLEHQYDLRRLPEILNAQRRHAQFIRRHGQTDHIADAYAHARYIVGRWAERGDWDRHRRRRLSRYLDDVDQWHIPHHDPLAVMVRYPDIVTLAIMLADPHWVTLAIRGGPAGLDRFHAEIRSRLKIPYQAYTSFDPLVQWRKLHRQDAAGLIGTPKAS